MLQGHAAPITSTCFVQTIIEFGVSKVTLDDPFDLRPETDPGLKCHGYRRLVLSLINVAK